MCGLWIVGALGIAAEAMAAPTAVPVAAQDHPPYVSEFVGSAKCATCHEEMAKGFATNPHATMAQMPSSDGVTCESCHGPGRAHADAGGDVTKIVDPVRIAEKDAQNPSCTKCHAEMAGPFVYEHPVVKTEGCLSCHSIHGSQNARLLNESNIDTLCRQCHAPTSSTKNQHAVSATDAAQNNTAQDRSCMACHTQIHGSNASNVFMK